MIMDPRGKKKNTRAGSSSRSNVITRRHLRAPEDDPPHVHDLRTRNVIVEKAVDLNHIARFGLFPILQSVGWENILLWGGPAYQSIAQAMIACITDFSLEQLTFTIATREGPCPIDRHLISGLMDISVNDEGLHPSTLAEKVTESEKHVYTRALCNLNAPWSQNGTVLASRYLLPKYRVLHRIFTSNLYPRSGNKTELTLLMVRILYSIITGANICLPSLICYYIIQFRIHPGHSDIPFGYLLNVLATNLLVAMPVGEAPIQHLIFNNTNINKMKLQLAPGQVDVDAGEATAGAGNDEGGDDLPPDDIDMDDIFNEIESDSGNDPDYEPSDVNARLSALEEKVESMHVSNNQQFKNMRRYFRRLQKSLHQSDPNIPAPSSGSD